MLRSLIFNMVIFSCQKYSHFDIWIKILIIMAHASIKGSDGSLTLYLMEATFNAFANRAEPDQAAYKSCLIRVYSAHGNMIRYDPTLVDLTSNFFVLCRNIYS